MAYEKITYCQLMAEPILTIHGKYRLLERGIDVHEAKKIAKSGKITKKQLNDTIIKEGIVDGKKLFVVTSNNKKGITIITAYYES